MQTLKRHVWHARLTYAVLVLLLTVAAGVLLLTTKPSCASQDPYAGADLVITPANKGCTYSLRVGQSFDVRVDAGPGASKFWPIYLSDENLVREMGAMVGSPSPVWIATYRAEKPGTLVVEHFDITIRIQG